MVFLGRVSEMSYTRFLAGPCYIVSAKCLPAEPIIIIVVVISPLEYQWSACDSRNVAIMIRPMKKASPKPNISQNTFYLITHLLIRDTKAI